MGRRGESGESIRPRVTDIGVERTLAPEPTILFFIDGETLAEKNLRIETGIVRRPVAQIDHGPRCLKRTAFDESRSFDLAFEMHRREIGARRGNAFVVSDTHDALP